MATKTRTEKAQDFEASLRQLEEIVEKLEQGNVPLEKALALYEEGIVLARSCGELLNTAEIRFKRLARDLEGNLKLFDQQEESEE